ncbi:thioredoxin family protein [Candidatus Sumerlaeota bacterium]|nr:thioredoxin family protein [Candidatus Sumerlaeota bacterium]
MKLGTFLILTGLLGLLTGSAAAQWQSAGKLALPKYSYSFLAATPNGDLLAATFNSSGPKDPPREIPALLIENPSITPHPRIIELCRTPFDAQRGYGGIACDLSGSFFLSGDTGLASTSFVRKFLSTGRPDLNFGVNGEVKLNRRCLGLDVAGRYLLVAVDWAQVAILDSASGRQLGMVNTPVQGEVNVRDIAVDPKSLRIFGVASGAVVTWGGGAPWKPEGYQFRALSKAYGNPRAGEGISIDPFNRTVLITPKPGNVLLEIEGSMKVNRFTVDSAAPSTHLADSVMSFDGSSLYVSDMIGGAIHVMKRPARTTPAIASAPAPATSAQAPPFVEVASAAPTQTTAGNGGNPNWFPSYNEVVKTARESNKPMLVYFTQNGVAKAREFEKDILMTKEFAAQVQEKNFVCVFEDVGRNKLSAYQFGARRVPHVIILSSHGDTAAEFSYDIDKAQLFSAMSAVN